MTLEGHVPALLARARSLLRLPGGPAGELSSAEVRPAARAVLELHQGLVGDRALAQPGTYAGRHLGAYLLWWWPQTYIKVQATLAMVRLPRAPRILDVGSGPAPAALAALDLLGGEVTCFDVGEDVLAEARALGIARTTRELPEEDFDLTLVANVLSEVADPLALLRRQRGTIVIVEPALRETGRALLLLRDAMLRDGWFALAPCFTQAPCPALVSPKDWCTAEARWQPPRFFRQLADATGLRADELLSFAPLVLGRIAPEAQRDVWRVVGVAPPEKGKKRVWICGPEERLPLVRLDRDRAPQNATFDDLRRGDRVRVHGTERRGDGLRIRPDSRLDSA
ncbi:MAG TPA: small ribosomal subunit Rsm22 family protein [Myxococcales bacterium]|nr:small ribosomal subunit Rsm22 family protein [Myxococcales bacterium]